MSPLPPLLGALFTRAPHSVHPGSSLCSPGLLTLFARATVATPHEYEKQNRRTAAAAHDEAPQAGFEAGSCSSRRPSPQNWEFWRDYMHLAASIWVNNRQARLGVVSRKTGGIASCPEGSCPRGT